MKRFIKIIAMRNLKYCGYHFFVVNGLPQLDFEDTFLPIQVVLKFIKRAQNT